MRTIFAQVRLIDGVADTAIDGADVVVDGERITAVVAHGTPPREDPVGDGARVVVIDGRGYTLLPGLIDAHAHYTFDPTEGSIATIALRTDAASRPAISPIWSSSAAIRWPTSGILGTPSPSSRLDGRSS